MRRFSPRRKSQWRVGTVLSIRQNEKYRVDRPDCVPVTLDFMTKRKLNRRGTANIISKKATCRLLNQRFLSWQEEFRRRKNAGGHTSAINCFANRLPVGSVVVLRQKGLAHVGSNMLILFQQCNHKYGKKNQLQQHLI